MVILFSDRSEIPFIYFLAIKRTCAHNLCSIKSLTIVSFSEQKFQLLELFFDAGITVYLIFHINVVFYLIFIDMQNVV